MPAQQTRDRLFSKGLKGVQFQPANFKIGNSDYIPLTLQGLMLGERLTFALYLKAGDSQWEDFRFFSYLDKGEVLDAKWLEPLARIGIKSLYFHSSDLSNVIAYLNNHLQLLEVDGAERTREKLNIMAEHLSLTLRQATANPRLGVNIDPALKQVDKVIEEFHKNKPSQKLIWEILFWNYSLYHHSVNVCLLAVAMMLFMKRSTKDSRLLGSAALVMDLGMTRLSDNVIYKTDKLTSEEWEETKQHPLIGSLLLRRYAALTEEGIRLVLEHHENADGSGYPRGIPLNRQHPWTRILRLLDAYDALTTNRPQRPAISPFAALKKLQLQEGSWGPIFDPATLKEFIRFLAIC